MKIFFSKKMQESDIEDKNFLVSLRNIDRNRICFTVGQLEMILRFKDPIFNKIFIGLCDLELMRKKGISLNFIDLSNLIDQARKEAKKRSKSTRCSRRSLLAKKKEI